MRQEENERYEQWLQQVRKTQPILTRPDDLTRNILQKVARTPRKRKEHRKFMAWASAVAAGFLLCFMVHETVFYSVSSNAGTGCRVKCFSFVPPFIRMAGRPERRHEPKGKECLSVRNVESTEG